ncbi:palmitoyltransferase ZDHHC13-like [Rhynchophorus ferrugineus]|uniref:palmitoyltransferase ZDHHC13-like n=1 Tax=Rhynchophorus ferrugineus TaxID=354439 RepID=UPI003FCCFBD7
MTSTNKFKQILSHITDHESLKSSFLTAVHTGDESLLRYCLTNGASPNFRNKEHLTALHIAATKGDLAIGALLLEQKSTRIDAEDDMGDTPLLNAISNIHLKFVILLLKNRANPNVRNHFDKTGLHIAVSAGVEHIVTVLLHYKADPNVVDTYGNTPLSLSLIEHPNDGIAKILMASGANPNYRTMKPHPLFLELCLNCYSKKQLKYVKLLLNYGVDINIKNNISKQTALHIVSIAGYVPLAEFLLDNGADPTLKDVLNRTPFDVAEQHEHRDLVLMFKEREFALEHENSIEERSSSSSSVTKRKHGYKSVKFSESSDDEFVII